MAVLVHGTTQSPCGWQRLVEALHARGHRAHLVDLPCDQPDLAGSDYAAVAQRQTGGQLSGSPVVVGHSGAGVVLPEIGAALGARHLVWLAAAVPDFEGGTSLRDAITSAGPSMFNDEWLTLREPPTTDLLAATYFLFHDCTFDSLRWAVSTLRLFYPDTAYREGPSVAPSVPSTFVLPTQDRTLRPEWMRSVARRQLQIEPVEIDAGHCPHVSRPESLAEIIMSL